MSLETLFGGLAILFFVMSLILAALCISKQATVDEVRAGQKADRDSILLYRDKCFSLLEAQSGIEEDRKRLANVEQMYRESEDTVYEQARRIRELDQVNQDLALRLSNAYERGPRGQFQKVSGVSIATDGVSIGEKTWAQQ